MEVPEISESEFDTKRKVINGMNIFTEAFFTVFLAFMSVLFFFNIDDPLIRFACLSLSLMSVLPPFLLTYWNYEEKLARTTGYWGKVRAQVSVEAIHLSFVGFSLGLLLLLAFREFVGDFADGLQMNDYTSICAMSYFIYRSIKVFNQADMPTNEHGFLLSIVTPLVIILIGVSLHFAGICGDCDVISLSCIIATFTTLIIDFISSVAGKQDYAPQTRTCRMLVFVILSIPMIIFMTKIAVGVAVILEKH